MINRRSLHIISFELRIRSRADARAIDLPTCPRCVNCGQRKKNSHFCKKRWADDASHRITIITERSKIRGQYMVTTSQKQPICLDRSLHCKFNRCASLLLLHIARDKLVCFSLVVVVVGVLFINQLFTFSGNRISVDLLRIWITVKWIFWLCCDFHWTWTISRTSSM